eukprot:COSAG01_NODE_75640_length_194_cov_31.305263_1_plen_31_part_01
MILEQSMFTPDELGARFINGVLTVKGGNHFV